MNLKESFRYQNFLEAMMGDATDSLLNREHCLTVTKNHLRSKANPDVEDVQEVVDNGKFFANDGVLALMLVLTEERDELTNAIGAAKASLNFDLDAAVATNKFRQAVADAAKNMLRYSASRKMERGTDYKFNVEGNQTQYYYDIEVDATEAFDRERTKTIMRDMMSVSDRVSAEIDLAMINTVVDYDPPFDVNDSFEDVMTEFLAKA